MKTVYAPGCALMLYHPALAEKVQKYLSRAGLSEPMHKLCCRYEPGFAESVRLINTCSGCDRRFRDLYAGVSTISLWEIIAADEHFPWPRYEGLTVSIQDACPTRSEERVHVAVRKLLMRMNIAVQEAAASGTGAKCCGDCYVKTLGAAEAKHRMRERAQEMPTEHVVVYCVSCIKSMHVGGRTPLYLPALLFGETTEVGVSEPEEWHRELDRYISQQGSPAQP
ncbi:MAG: (Fe-S)-binding protein [Peptococcaceae bacterium]|nr:(Fe-S)-binding protein [Peptococcaceae bacterium]